MLARADVAGSSDQVDQPEIGTFGYTLGREVSGSGQVGYGMRGPLDIQGWCCVEAVVHHPASARNESGMPLQLRHHSSSQPRGC